MSERNTITVPNIAGFFVWEQGLRGPVPVKISVDRNQYLSQKTWNEKTLKTVPLNQEDWELSLDELGKKYPL